MILTLLAAPVLFRPVSTPSATSTLVANTPARSGWAEYSAVIAWAALVGLSPTYWVASGLMFGNFLISFRKPWIRCSVVETPGCSFITTTEPLPPISLAISSAALAPPSMLSEEMDAAAIELSATVVSTWTTLMPADFIAFIGAISAWVSVGAMRTAPGFWAVTALTIGICSGAAKSAGPWTLIE